MSKNALLIVDLQNDFCPGGALAVSDGDRIIPITNDLVHIFEGNKEPVFASRDWHPQKHISFKEQGGPWPPHCIQSTKGAEFHPSLKFSKHPVIISKATEENEDSYSAFGGKNRDGKTLLQNLQRLGIKKIFVVGLALDYCVKATALDAKKLGFEVVVFENATRAVNIKPDDGRRAIEEMKKAGVVIENFYPFVW